MAYVKCAIRKGEAHPVPDHAVPQPPSRAGHGVPEGLHEGAPCASPAKRFGEVARPPTDVDHPPARHRFVLLDERHRVVGQEGIEAVGVFKLRAKALKEAERTSYAP